MERTWDIEPTNNAKIIEKMLETGPQLCQVLSENIRPETLLNLTQDFYLFAREIDGQDRVVILCGAYKAEGDLTPDPEKTQKAFGRQITENQIYDDLVHIEGVPYFPFCKGLDVNLINRMRVVYDIRDIHYDSEDRIAVFGHYYDVKTSPKRPGRVIAQAKPILTNTK